MINGEFQETLARYVYEDAPVLMLVFDRAGEVVEANRFAEALLRAPVCGRKLGEVFVDFEGSLTLERLLQGGGEPRGLDVNTFTRLPQTYYFRFFEFGDRVLTLGRLDWLEQERLRSEILSLNAELNTLTRELHKNNAELTRLNELKSQFLGIAAHDLRKPLHVVVLASECLSMGAQRMEPERLQRFVGMIADSCEAMKRLIDDYLDVAMIESGQLRLDRKQEDLAAVIERARSLLRFHAEAKGIEVVIEHDPAIPPLWIDSAKIEQVVANLLCNAVDHSPQGHTARIRSACEQDRVTVAVLDEGAGLSQEELQKLFRPYQRAGAPKTGGERSLGLGLVISRKIIEAHGGAVRVESQPGAGSVFQFSLPIES
ncbi:MAG: ATP-binding protein [Planctomycetota bacterium]